MNQQSAQNLEIFNTVLATVVLYNTSLDNSITFRSLTESLEKAQMKMDLLVYDNSPIARTPHESAWWRIHYVHNPSNPGVSQAYNAGYTLASELKKNWLLLLDQDTRYPGSSLADLAEAVQNHPDQSIFIPQLRDNSRVVSPLIYQLGGGHRVTLKEGIHSLQNYLFHNCGLFISLLAFNKAGGYDERFKLDFSDFSFIQRLRKHHTSFVQTKLIGYHNLATTSKATVQERATRFSSYVQACRLFWKEYQPTHWLPGMRLFLRALKLSFQYRSIRFVKIYMQNG